MAAASQGTKLPGCIEDLLWNLHTVLASATGPLPVDQLKDTYTKKLGHKCAIERFLVIGEGGLAATLRRIPHIVTLFQTGSTTCAKATLPLDIDKQQLLEADQQYRRELVKKNISTPKAKSSALPAKAAAGGVTPEAAPAKAAAPVAASVPVPAAAPASVPAEAQAAVAAEAKRPAESPAAGDAKRARAENTEQLSRMLVQGVVRVLQNRVKAGDGPLPLELLEEEFKALWKVPFNLAQAGESDAIAFLQKWPNKLELVQSGSQHLVQLPQKALEKAKGAEVPKAVAPVVAIAKVASAAKPDAAEPAEIATAEAASPTSSAAAGEEAATPSNTKPRTGGPLRPPVQIEDFLWNLYSVLETSEGTLPLDQLTDAYSKHLGHKFAIERFIVVPDGDLAAALKRIPHIVTVREDGTSATVTSTLPPGTTKEQLLVVDQQYPDHGYRALCLQKSGAAKAASPAVSTSAAKSSAPIAPPADALVQKVTPVAPVAPVAPAVAAGTEGEREAKRPKIEDADTLGRMLVQGVVRVLQNRQKEGLGPLPINELEAEFKALWKVPFNLQQAGEADPAVFLQKWPNKVEVVSQEDGLVVQLPLKKAVAKGAPAVPPKEAAAAPTPATPVAKGTPLAVPDKAASSSEVPVAEAPAAEPAVAKEAPAAPVGRPVPPKAAVAAQPVAAAAPPKSAAAARSAEEAKPFSLAQAREEAIAILQAMQDAVKRQEALVTALQSLNDAA